MDERSRAALEKALNTIRAQKEKIVSLEGKLTVAEDRIRDLEAQLKSEKEGGRIGAGDGGGGAKKREKPDSATQETEKAAKVPKKEPTGSEGATSQKKPAVASGALTAQDILSLRGKRETPSASSNGAAAAGADKTLKPKRGRAASHGGHGGDETRSPVDVEEVHDDGGGYTGDGERGPTEGVGEAREKDLEDVPERSVKLKDEPPSPKRQKGREGEEEPVDAMADLAAEAEKLWKRIQGRPFPEQKYVQITINQYVYNKQTIGATADVAAATLERVALLLADGGRIPPQEAMVRILRTYRRKMNEVLIDDSAAEWLKAPPRQGTELYSVCSLTVSLVLRLCNLDVFGAFFLDQVLESLTISLCLARKEGIRDSGDGSDHDSEASDSDDESRTKKARASEGPYHLRTIKEKERDSFAAGLLYVWLCRRAGEIDRVRALLHDLLAAHGRDVSVAVVPTMMQAWPAVVGPEGGLMRRVVLALLCEAQAESPDALRDSAKAAMDGLMALVGLDAHEQMKSDVVENDVLQRWRDDPDGENMGDVAVNDLLRSMQLLVAARPLDWSVSHVLEEMAGQDDADEVHPLGMRIGAELARDLSLRGVLVNQSAELQRKLVGIFTNVLSIPEGNSTELTGWEEDEDQMEVEEGKKKRWLAKLWACYGLACIPGLRMFDLRAAVEWMQSVQEEQYEALPSFVCRKVLVSQQRPHCVVIFRETSAPLQANLDKQVVLHDISMHTVTPQLLEEMTQKTLARMRSNAPAGQIATGGLEHLALWQLYMAGRMTELAYPSGQPPEIVILEADVVGSPLLGSELRSLLSELRRRHAYDALSLCFAVPEGQLFKQPKGQKAYSHRAPSSAFICSRAYILTLNGAKRLHRTWAQYQSVEEQLMTELRQGGLNLLLPGDGRPLFHLDTQSMVAFKSHVDRFKESKAERTVLGMIIEEISTRNPPVHQ